jgi:hypothetical protein
MRVYEREGEHQPDFVLSPSFLCCHRRLVLTLLKIGCPAVCEWMMRLKMRWLGVTVAAGGGAKKSFPSLARVKEKSE